jgi:exodeoxyribonuclease VII large subunit
LIYPATMQGPSCASTVAAGVRWFNRHAGRDSGHVDVILIARGGGSFEDLAGFNDEALARVIAASALPVISAIGHETDTTIADFVADLRAPAPSAAAELITAAQHRVEERVHALERRVQRAGQYQLMVARQRLARLSADQVLTRLRDSIGRRAQRIDELRFRLTASSGRVLRTRGARLTSLEACLRRHDPTVRLASASHRLQGAQESLKRMAAGLTRDRAQRAASLTARLDALSPLAVLNRGYAIVFGPDGSILRDATQVAPHQEIRARLARGTVRANVTENR